MKKMLFALAIAVLPASLLLAQTDKTPYMVKSLSGETIKNVEVQTAGGGIYVEGVSGNTRVEVYVTGNNGKNNLTKEQIEKIITEKYDLNVSVSNNTITAVAKNKQRNNDWRNGLSFSFKVYAPVNVSTELTTSGGSIGLNNLSGNLSFTTSGGSLNVNNVSGKVDGTTSGGSIKVTNSKNDITLTTSGGSIEANNCDGDLKLTTSGGALRLNNLSGTIKANTSGGSIHGDDITGELKTHTSGGSIHLAGLSCSLETSTSGGKIDVAIVTPGKYIRIGNSSGDITLQLPKNTGLDLNLAARRISTDALNNFSGKIDDEAVIGKLNGGGVAVNVNAGSGKISLSIR